MEGRRGNSPCAGSFPEWPQETEARSLECHLGLPRGCRGPSIWAILCFCRYMSRGLDRKGSSWAWNGCCDREQTPAKALSVTALKVGLPRRPELSASPVGPMGDFPHPDTFCFIRFMFNIYPGDIRVGVLPLSGITAGAPSHLLASPLAMSIG